MKLQNSWFLTHACSSLILQPVARRSMNADFLKIMTSKVGSVPFSRNSRTVLSFQLGAVEIVLGLWSVIALKI